MGGFVWVDGQTLGQGHFLTFSELVQDFTMSLLVIVDPLTLSLTILNLQENIASFGGDPNCVTLLGQGTGASLTSLLLLSPITQVRTSSVLALPINLRGRIFYFRGATACFTAPS